MLQGYQLLLLVCIIDPNHNLSFFAITVGPCKGRNQLNFHAFFDYFTGGTGGVHRGGELSLDVSTDLIELSRTPVVVISAGVKSILDVKRTLEVLETFGVPTGVWKSSEFPSFFSPLSGVNGPARFDDAMDVASAYLSSIELGMENGMLVVCLQLRLWLQWSFVPFLRNKYAFLSKCDMR